MCLCRFGLGYLGDFGLLRCGVGLFDSSLGYVFLLISLIAWLVMLVGLGCIVVCLDDCGVVRLGFVLLL